MNRFRFDRPTVPALVHDSDLRLFDDERMLLDESPAAVGAAAEFCK